MNEIQFLIYDEGGQTEVLVQDETLWATQKVLPNCFLSACRPLTNT